MNGDQFATISSTTSREKAKAGQRFQMIGVYTVANGKVVRGVPLLAGEDITRIVGRTAPTFGPFQLELSREPRRDPVGSISRNHGPDPQVAAPPGQAGPPPPPPARPERSRPSSAASRNPQGRR